MNFETASIVESICNQMKLADYKPALNRARINSLFNGAPPFKDEERRNNPNQRTNVNDLSSTRIAHDARNQFANAFLTPDPLFQIQLDYGPAYKKTEWAGRLTKEVNKAIKDSASYVELQRSVFASVVLHGIGPAIWENRFGWCQEPVGVEDVFLPDNTLLGMKNLPFFAVYRQYTAMQLWQMTHGPKVDPGWNTGMAEKAVKWADSEAQKLMGSSWPEVWSPEKIEEHIKRDGGLYASDAVPTIDCYDFYFFRDEKKQAGWHRKIIVDAWGSPGIGGIENFGTSRKHDYSKGEFLYDSDKRKNGKYADKLSQIIHFQFGDCSPVSPFRYHGVRGLGFLLYAVCHLQNRLKCRFNDSVFESLMQYFRVHNPEDAERAIKINLQDKGVIQDGVDFVKQQDRWQVNEGLAQMAMELNRQTMSDVSSSFTQDHDLHDKQKGRETATRTMAKVNATAALVGAMLNQAYTYEKFRYLEICRRFCLKNSTDSDVRRARVRCLKSGVPEEAFNVDAWDISPTRVTGGGNKMLQLNIADKLLAIRQMLDPESQKEVDRIYIAANTDDWDLTQRLVPDQKHVSDAVHDAQLASGTLMLGLPVSLQTGINHIEYVETLLTNMAAIIQRIEASGGMATADQILGLQNVAQHLGQHLQIIAQDENEKGRVKQYGDALGKMMNMVKAYGQRLQEQSQKQNGQGAQLDPKDAAKIQGMMLTAKTKAQLASQSHAERTAQRRITFEQQMEQDQQKHKLELAKKATETAHDIQLNRLRAFTE